LGAAATAANLFFNIYMKKCSAVWIEKPIKALWNGKVSSCSNECSIAYLHLLSAWAVLFTNHATMLRNVHASIFCPYNFKIEVLNFVFVRLIDFMLMLTRKLYPRKS